jgi:hypothetical protein
MGIRNPPEKQRGYDKAYRERKRAEGLRQLLVWVRPEDVERVRAYARELAGRIGQPGA